MLFVIFSSEISPRDNSVHMRWFFEIIRDGLRSKTDWSVLKSMDLLNICIVVFKYSNEKEKVSFKKNFNFTIICISLSIIYCFYNIRY